MPKETRKYIKKKKRQHDTIKFKRKMNNFSIWLNYLWRYEWGQGGHYRIANRMLQDVRNLLVDDRTVARSSQKIWLCRKEIRKEQSKCGLPWRRDVGKVREHRKGMCVGKGQWNEEILKHHVTIGRTVKLYSHCGKQHGDSSKINRVMTVCSSNLISEHRFKRIKSIVLRDICMPLFVILVTVANM